MSASSVHHVVVHPLVLLSVVDHFNRIGKVTSVDRVVGILLGQWITVDGEKILDVSNSFAVPYDEDRINKEVWYLDHDYLGQMYGMFRKVNARERIVGWYHTGPNLCHNDIAIHDVIKRYEPNCILVIVNVKPKEVGLPTRAYIDVEEIHDDGTPTTRTFEHLPSEIGAEMAEEFGVEHLLRDVHHVNARSLSLSQGIIKRLQGLKGLGASLTEIHSYLEKVTEDEVPANNAIIYLLQNILSLMPDVNIEEFTKAVYIKTNDQMLVLYLASIIRAVLGLHNLINNKTAMNKTDDREWLKKCSGNQLNKKPGGQKKYESAGPGACY